MQIVLTGQLEEMINTKVAIVAFDRVARDYPNSEKVPNALLQIGMTLLSAGNKPKAKEYFDYLIVTYPNTSSAREAYVKKQEISTEKNPTEKNSAKGGLDTFFWRF